MNFREQNNFGLQDHAEKKLAGCTTPRLIANPLVKSNKSEYLAAVAPFALFLDSLSLLFLIAYVFDSALRKSYTPSSEAEITQSLNLHWKAAEYL